MIQKEYSTKSGFDLRLEARLKNAQLVSARERLGLSAKEAVKKIGISYQTLWDYENLRSYPAPKTQHKICEFYRKQGFFIFEDDVFPEELRQVKLQPKYIAESSVPLDRLISLYYRDRRLLPASSDNPEQNLIAQELAQKVNELLATLTPRQAKVIRARFGIGDYGPKTLEEIGQDIDLSKERIWQIEEKALSRLREPEITRKLREVY